MLRETIIALGGISVGYFLARAVLQKEYDEKLNEEIERTREFFSLEAEEEARFVEIATEAMVEYQGDVLPTGQREMWATTTTPEEPVGTAQRDPETRPPGPIPYNRMSEVERKVEDIVQNAPAAPLDPNARAPYLITFAEYDSGPEEVGYEQVTLSFFAGDGIVIDEEDKVLKPDRVEQIVGIDNLNRFGTQTDDPNMDPNVIYVRCERFNMDFEVTRSPGFHAVEVLGQQPE